MLVANIVNDERPTHLDLFSGIGGFALAARQAGFRTVGFCEIDKYCQEVLKKNFGVYSDADQSNGSSEPRQQQKELAAQPHRICSDIRDLDGRDFAGITLITGGFPCQPFSYAGKRRGKEDDRHLWPEMLRVIKEARPAWVLGENVAGIIGMELDSVLSDLETIGYTTRPFVIPACGVDAKHRRNRVWIIAHTECDGFNGRDNLGRGSIPLDEKQLAAQDESKRSGRISGVSTACEISSNARIEELARRRPKSEQQEATTELGTSDACRWQPEPNVGRVAHGIPSRVDRLRGLGNAIVPQVAYEILKVIYDQETAQIKH